MLTAFVELRLLLPKRLLDANIRIELEFIFALSFQLTTIVNFF